MAATAALMLAAAISAAPTAQAHNFGRGGFASGGGSGHGFGSFQETDRELRAGRPRAADGLDEGCAPLSLNGFDVGRCG